jgi:hypothetical protein
LRSSHFEKSSCNRPSAPSQNAAAPPYPRKAEKRGPVPFWQGGTRFEKRREQLTAKEVALLADLKTLVSTGECWSDVGEAEVTVTGNGSAQEYSANEYDGGCDRGVELVTYAPVIGLLESARCLTAKGYDGSSLATAGHVRADDGCYHGIFNATATTREWWFVLEVAEPAT